MARVEGHDESLDVLDGYDGRVWPAIRSTSRFRIAAAGLLTLALSAAGGFYLGAHRYPTPAAVADEVVVLAVPGGRPSGAGLAAGSVWVTTWDGFVVRVDPETRKMVRIAVGGSPLAAQEGAFFLLGGIEVGQGTLLRFYVAHVIVFPLITAIFLVIHFWRIRKDGGISGPV